MKTVADVNAIQMRGWPQVELEFVRQASDDEALQWLEDMNGLLARKQPFVMLIHARPNSQFSPEARKALGLWFKEQRANLGQYCLGVARLVDNVEQGQRVVGEKMQAAMPFPMMAVTSVHAANHWLRQQLN
ncbi:hypothetical protein [Parendozoicomonas haliclonae]|uniref:STAS/SEC14 domain-containing protein n=1 Tax=Parendozoicomonas haliclonae TaxID=1960125 RepID=A0A1X7ARR3_9GAMM|nr:hypothetical protein [Parendozoicomonas haliclonae]SMA50925.1 hypothetical protein EHSB41UT_04743 [Parendozoicomonas haliclonae]